MTLYRRTNTLRWELLNRDLSPAGEIDVEHGSGQIDESIYTDIGASGRCTSLDTDVDWDQHLLRPILTVDGVEHVQGTFIPAVGETATTRTRQTAPVTLYDRTLILRQTRTPVSQSIPAGQRVTDMVGLILSMAGDTRWNITPSDAELAAPMVWEPRTPLIRMVNDLLGAINYFGVWVDLDGTFTAAPYVAPADRPIVHGFSRDFQPEWVRGLDTFSAPNRITLTTRPPDEETPGLLAVATNEDPAHPLSYPRRGRWIDDGEDNVDAASQAVLDALAARRLAEASTVAAKLSITHPWLPLPRHSAVTFVSDRTGTTARGTITEKTTRYGTAVLTRSTIREYA